MIEAYQLDEAKSAYHNSKLQQQNQINTDRYGEYKIKIYRPKKRSCNRGKQD